MMKCLNFLSIFFIIAILSPFHDGARILMVFPPAVPSHFILSNQLATGLSNRGHDVTVLNPLVGGKSTNYNGIVLTRVEDVFKELQKMLLDTSENPLMLIKMLMDVTRKITEESMKCKNLKNLLSSNMTFDLVIVECMFNEAHLGISNHFKAPTIIFSSVGANPMINLFNNNPSSPAYINSGFHDYVHKMNFLQRFKNTLITLVTSIYDEYVRLPMQDKILHEHFPDAPPVKELMRNISLILLNSHPSISMAVPTSPDMIDIGGYHVAEPKELPQNLKEYLDTAENGFILFSMGSHFQYSLYPMEYWEAFLTVFSKLPYKILWKFQDKIVNNAKNVRIEKWIPQNDVLAHKNIKLFITHGGLLSTTEAVYHGVPLVGIPAFGDQKMNILKAEQMGIAKYLDLKNLTEYSITAAISEVLNNPSYKNNIKMRSEIMRDRPMKPMDTAIYWIEYILRHKHSRILKTGAIDLEWYELYLIDVISLIVVLLVVILLLLYILYKVTKRIISCICRRKKQKSD